MPDNHCRTAAVALIAALFVSPGGAAAADLGEAIAGGKTSLGVRYRFEQVDQEPFAKNAIASTARMRMTWTSAPAGPVTLGIETDYLAAFTDSFNSTTNGQTGYPVVPDPEGLDLNQSFVRFASGAWTATAGRQRIVHGTARMLGNVGFRQNEQTYDALRFVRAGDALDVDYAYVHNVNRIFGPDDGAQPADWHGDSHILRASIAPGDGHTIVLFSYLLDFANANGPRFSSATHGIEYDVAAGPFTAHASIARQTDWGGNPADYDADFFTLQVDFKQDPVTLQLGLQNLGASDGLLGFGTPLATLHKFQGWTDKFLATPRDGVLDRWIAFGTKLGKANATLVWHDFRAERGDAEYGTEAGVSLALPVHDNVTVLFKAARYAAEVHATDTSKYWLTLDWRL